MWIFIQKSGQMLQEGHLFAEAFCGYSGAGLCKNDPSAQSKHNEGPIPVGFYEIQPPQDSPLHGPFALALAPNMTNQMFGRSGFLIHGDSILHAGTASEGCIILDLAARETIWRSGDRDLHVLAERPPPLMDT